MTIDCGTQSTQTYSETDTESSPKTPPPATSPDIWSVRESEGPGECCSMPCASHSKQSSRSRAGSTQGPQQLPTDAKFYEGRTFDVPSTHAYESDAAYLDTTQDRHRSSVAVGHSPVSFLAPTQPNAFCAQCGAIHDTHRYHADTYDLSLPLPVSASHIDGGPVQSPYGPLLPAAFASSTDCNSALDLTTARASQSYLDSQTGHLSYSSYPRARSTSLSTHLEDFTMSRHTHSGPETPSLADQYGPPLLRYPSRSAIQGDFRHVLSVPESSHTHMHQPAAYPVSSSPAPSYSAVSSGYNQSTPVERVCATLRFPEYQQLVAIHTEETSDPSARKIEPELHPLVDKNIFFNDTATCYRRNYISVQVSYSLPACAPGTKLYCADTTKGGPRRIQAFAVTLSATIDKPQGKSVQLIQHTPKRDKGPKIDPPMVLLPPSPAGGGVVQAYPMTTSFGGPDLPLQNVEGQRSPFSTSQHTFERIQFQQATANNGRRRAQQQFYYLCAELHADCRLPGEPEPFWVKVTRRTSEAMVVRGRSPGHYKDGSNDTAGNGQGPGSASGGGGSFVHEGYLPRGPESVSTGMGASFRAPTNSGGTSYHSQRHAHNFVGDTSPAYTTHPSPVLSHGGTPSASPYSEPIRYPGEVSTLRGAHDDYRTFHGDIQYMQQQSPAHDMYAALRPSKSDHSLDLQHHGLPAFGFIKSDPSSWHSITCRKYEPVNAGFALDSSAGY